jgi:hypothetical protein
MLKFLFSLKIWCQNGHLFVDESSSGDVVQVTLHIYMLYPIISS